MKHLLEDGTLLCTGKLPEKFDGIKLGESFNITGLKLGETFDYFTDQDGELTKTCLLCRNALAIRIANIREYALILEHALFRFVAEPKPEHLPTCIPTDEVERAQVAEFIAEQGYCPQCRVVFRPPRVTP